MPIRGYQVGHHKFLLTTACLDMWLKFFFMVFPLKVQLIEWHFTHFVYLVFSSCIATVESLRFSCLIQIKHFLLKCFPSTRKKLICEGCGTEKTRKTVHDTGKDAQLGPCKAPNDSMSERFHRANSLYFFVFFSKSFWNTTLRFSFERITLFKGWNLIPCKIMFY